MNSLAVLSMHVAGAEQYWISDVVGNTTTDRDRQSEYAVKGLAATHLIQRLNASLALCHEVLVTLQIEDLPALRVTHDGHEFTVGWSLAHLLAHTALHTGQIQLTRQLWDQHHPGQV
jgi:uncharacterized damage-inducible protein DinB